MSLNYRKPGLTWKKSMMNIQKVDPDYPTSLCLVFFFFSPQSLENAVRRIHSVINYAGTSNEWSYDLASLLEMLMNQIMKCTFQPQLRESKPSLRKEHNFTCLFFFFKMEAFYNFCSKIHLPPPTS